MRTDYERAYQQLRFDEAMKCGGYYGFVQVVEPGIDVTTLHREAVGGATQSLVWVEKDDPLYYPFSWRCHIATWQGEKLIYL